MALDTVLQRFVEQCPVAVMAWLAIERAISAEWVDEVFDPHRQRQFTHELLFSTVVDLMALGTIGLRPLLHAAAKSSKDLKVSMAALYDKVNHVEPEVLQALVQGSAKRLAPVVAPLRQSMARSSSPNLSTDERLATRSRATRGRLERIVPVPLRLGSILVSPHSDCGRERLRRIGQRGERAGRSEAEVTATKRKLATVRASCLLPAPTTFQCCRVPSNAVAEKSNGKEPCGNARHALRSSSLPLGWEAPRVQGSLASPPEPAPVEGKGARSFHEPDNFCWQTRIARSHPGKRAARRDGG